MEEERQHKDTENIMETKKNLPLENLKRYKIVLASNSPRRKELLAGLGLEFVVRVPKDVEETYPAGTPISDVPLHIARLKADASRATMGADDLVITADTIVACDGRVLGKPTDLDCARQMLRSLSGRTHKVLTGVCITTAERQRAFTTETDVTFAQLTDEEIDYYVERYRPLDKAGAYGIQEWIGYVGVAAINGSFFNVMGLPVQRLYRELQLF